MDWVEALNKTLDYIEDNLSENITCSEIADHVYISNAHLQRGFYALTGLTINEYVRNRRLTLAGHELSAENAKVIDVAMKYGYETPESFSKAFSRFHDVTPSQAKRNGVNLKSYNRLIVKIIMEGGSVMDYRIEKKEAFSVVAKLDPLNKSISVIDDNNANALGSFWGPYLGQELRKKESDLSVCDETMPEIGDNVCSTYLFAKTEEEIPDGFEKWQIPASTWAVFKCEGETPEVARDETYKRLYSEWLPQAKYELDLPRDIHFHYNGTVDSPGDAEMWVAVKEK